MAVAPLTLSGSTDGKGIKVAATGDPGTTIHTGPSSASNYDQLTLYAFNSDTVTRTLTIEWGSNGSPDDLIIVPVPAKYGLMLIIDKLRLKGNATPLVVKAYADAANVVIIHGKGDRY